MSTALTQALILLDRADVPAAIRCCEQALRTAPADTEILRLLGAIHARHGRHVEAIALFRRALAIEPDSARLHEDLGTALLDHGAAADALPLLERAVALAPDSTTAGTRLAEALLAAGRPQDADALFERAFARDPRLGTLARAGDALRNCKPRAAWDLAREVARKDPDDVDALRLLAQAAVALERYRVATALYGRIVERAPRHVEAWRELALALKEAWRIEEAVAAAERALALAPDDARLQVLRAGMLARAGDPASAVPGFEEALRLRPDSPGTWLGYGHVLKTLGRADDGIAAYRRAIRQKPGFGEAWWSLANLKTHRFSDDDIAAMEVQIARGDIGEDALTHFCFALGKAREDRGEHDAAFAHYDRANRTWRRHVQYDPVQTTTEHDAAIAAFTPELFARLAGAGEPDPAPILIVGLPRSGSTLIEQILASHSHVDGTSELPELGRLVRSVNRDGGPPYPAAVSEFTSARCARLGRRYLEATQRHRRGRPRFTDKMPNNFALVGLLRLILPNARVINAKRHPLDTCLGCYKQHFASGQTFTYDLEELAEFYLEYDRLMAHWHAVLPGFVLDVQYEELIADQEGQTRRLLEFCGLPFEQPCLEFHRTERPVQTASSEQVRQPLYSSSVGHWRRYERHLAPATEILAPLLERDGYSTT